jgi:hypothetical protein
MRRVALAMACVGLAACSGSASSSPSPAASASSSAVPSASSAGATVMNDAVGSGPLTAFKNCDEFVRRMREVASAEIDRTGYGLQNLTSNQARTSDVRVRIAGPTAPDPAADGSTTSGFDTPSATKTNGRLVLTKSFSK